MICSRVYYYAHVSEYAAVCRTTAYRINIIEKSTWLFLWIFMKKPVMKASQKSQSNSYILPVHIDGCVVAREPLLII